jgi:hypothetical protein
MASLFLKPQQQELYEALVSRAKPCASMYLGAIKVLADQENPERFYLAAHSLRELMESIGPHLEVPIVEDKRAKGRGKLTEKFQKIEKLLLKTEQQSGNWNSTTRTWSGKIDHITCNLLKEIQTVRAWRGHNEELRRTRADRLALRFDPLHGALPDEIQQHRINEWTDAKDYFTRVAHHASPDEFEKWLLHLELLLLKGFRAAAKQSLEEIDKIIKDAEGK